MRRWACVVLTGMLLLLSACGADVDVILQNETESVVSEAAPEEISDATETVDGVVEETSAICVYICGAVDEPGVYELSEASRLYELVEQAGGLTAEADATSINLAQTLVDGDMVFVPTREESAAGITASAGQSAPSADTAAGGKVNINTADVSQLTTLNGIGEAKAAAIIAYREEHGAFQSIEEIMEVSGIAEGTFAKIQEDITV